MNIDELQSRTIDFLRFPLIVGVVFIHSYLSDERGTHLGGLYYYVSDFFSQVLARIAVPLFFYFSGLLYYKDNFTLTIYKRKIRSRVRSLLSKQSKNGY